jgi:hypothetical protein
VVIPHWQSYFISGHTSLAVRLHWQSLYIAGGHTSLVVTSHKRSNVSLADTPPVIIVPHIPHHTSLAVIWRSYLTSGHLAVIPHWQPSGGHTSQAVIWRSSGGHTSLAVIWWSYLTGGHAPVHKNLGRVAPAILDHRLGGNLYIYIFKFL